MRTDDATSYHSNSHWGSDLWNFGKEVWCNLEGRYMHIVADVSHLATLGYMQRICSLGIMGTKYIRDEAPQETLQI